MILFIEILKFFDDMGSSPRRISAPSEMKSVEKATEEIKRFLKVMDLEYTMKTIPRMKMMTHDLYEDHYFIEGNIQIGIYYGHRKQYGKVESFIFRFGYSNMDHVQEIFRSYDDFLARKKLISVWDVDIDKTLSLNK
ncbi:MAG: hypothetical protein KAH57_03625 [Thermoplasmata archaeon]|nr:hypothetical protein [Thermoplasmata archaeon]